MHQFKDCLDRTWDLPITIGSLDRLKGSVLNLDLTKLALESLHAVAELIADGPRFVHTIYILCRADEKGVSQQEFADGFDGDALAGAETAFRDGLIGFFRQPEVREAIRKMFEKDAELRTQVVKAATDRIDRLNIGQIRELAEAKMDQVISEALSSGLTKLNSSFGSLPGSSESTLAPSPSGS